MPKNKRKAPDKSADEYIKEATDLLNGIQEEHPQNPDKRSYEGMQYLCRNTVYRTKQVYYHQEHKKAYLPKSVEANLNLIIAKCNAANAQGASNDQTNYLLASAYFYLGNNKKAKESIQLIKIPKDARGHQYAGYLNRQGEILYRLKENNDAIKCFERATQITDVSAWPIYNCAIFYRDQKNWVKAGEYWNKLIAQVPGATKNIGELDHTVSPSDYTQWMDEHRAIFDKIPAQTVPSTPSSSSSNAATQPAPVTSAGASSVSSSSATVLTHLNKRRKTKPSTTTSTSFADGGSIPDEKNTATTVKKEKEEKSSTAENKERKHKSLFTATVIPETPPEKLKPKAKEDSLDLHLSPFTPSQKS